MNITEKINYDINLYACKGPPTLEEGKSPASESSLASENSGTEANND